MNIYLTLQEFKDGRVMFRRWLKVTNLVGDSTWQMPSCGGAYEKQTLVAFKWLHSAGMPLSPEEIPLTHSPFEATQ